MLVRRVQIQLAVFAILSVVTLAITSFYYAKLPRLFGVGRFTVAADFADTSGLYPQALVTFRGIDVGQVTGVHLRHDGVTVELRINDGTRIPAAARAEIHSTSAVGEQYVELVAPGDAGPWLSGGSVIPRKRTSGLAQASDMIDSVDALLRSIPKDKLAQALDGLDTAFSGQGTALRGLIDDSTELVRSATANLGPTIGLIQTLDPVLSTQQQLAGRTTRYVSDLASFADQLARSNTDLVGLLNSGAGFARQFSGFVSDNQQTLPLLLDNLTSVGQVVRTYLPGIQQVLVVYPALMAATPEALYPVRDQGGVKIDFKLNVNDPPPCITGFMPPSQRRDPRDVSVADTPAGSYCKVSATDPRDVRGARQLPCLNNPGVRAATPALCVGDTVAYADAARGSSQTAVPYEPTTGRFLAPNGQFYVLGMSLTPAGVVGDWRSLLLGPLGQ